MCKATRHEKLAPVFLRQLYGYVPPEGWRILPEIDCDIDYHSLSDAHKLSLGRFAFLVMKTADDTARGHRFIVLDKIDTKTRSLFEKVATECFGKIASRIRKTPGLNNP